MRQSEDSSQFFADIFAETSAQNQQALEQRIEAQRCEAQVWLQMQHAQAAASELEKTAMRQKFNDLFL